MTLLIRLVVRETGCYGNSLSAFVADEPGP